MVSRRPVGSLVGLSCRTELKTMFSASYLRQSVLMSSFEAPEMRALYNNSLKNVAGKVKIDKRWSPIEIPDGVKPVRRNSCFSAARN